MFNLIKTALACLAVSAAGAAAVRAADLTRYENPEFGIAGMVPVDFSAWTEMKDGKGRIYQTPDGRATVAIHGGTIPAGAMDQYKEFTRGAFVGNGGSVTYEANGDDWFVLSGV
ncbi:hypothetical protein [Jhaorihella thermophila]|uniref:Uncharacterized protein n=1 Tax=Jhaorihella thermophila TaxID=488547 RepID=A0A1H5Y4J4_9RHOB|nr:hypothetical protein [Jhaorihella thermophila]SEG18617.1 hypothetical protein SAMN05421751_11455 [Jhaorihella thermophila]